MERKFFKSDKAQFTNDFLNMARFYHWTGKELSMLTGLSESTISRVNQGKRYLLPNTKEGEIIFLLLQIFHNLNIIMEHHHQKSLTWLHAKNQAFNYQKPIDCMKNIVGLVNVLHFLENQAHVK